MPRSLSPQRSYEDRSIAKSDLVRLMRRDKTRAIEACAPEPIGDDWVTSEVLITTVRAAAPIENRDESASEPIVVIPGQSRQIDNRSESKYQKLNYLAIASIGSMLCLMAMFSFSIWKSSQLEDQSKDRVTDRQFHR